MCTHQAGLHGHLHRGRIDRPGLGTYGLGWVGVSGPVAVAAHTAYPRARDLRALTTIYSLAHPQIFSSYIYLITDPSNTKVGAITGMNGLAMMAVAPFCGWWTDKHRRDWMLRVAGVVGIVVALATMVGVMEGHFPLLCACLVGWGVYGGIQSPAMEALFADSIEPGERSRVFTLKYALTQLASGT